MIPRKARRDENELGLVQYLLACGWSVVRLSQPGVPDLLIGKPHHTQLVEVVGPAKQAKYKKTGGLTPTQVEWHGTWKGSVWIVKNLEELRNHLQSLADGRRSP